AVARPDRMRCSSAQAATVSRGSGVRPAQTPAGNGSSLAEVEAGAGEVLEVPVDIRLQADREHGGVDPECRRQLGANAGGPREPRFAHPPRERERLPLDTVPRDEAAPLKLEGEALALHLDDHARGAGAIETLSAVACRRGLFGPARGAASAVGPGWRSAGHGVNIFSHPDASGKRRAAPPSPGDVRKDPRPHTGTVWARR